MRKQLSILLLSGVATLAMADGAALFKKCGICHGEQGQKRSLNVSKVIAGWKAEDVVEALKAYKEKSRNQYGFGNMMGGQATKLTDEQMREVAEYVESLPKPEETKPAAQ